MYSITPEPWLVRDFWESTKRNLETNTRRRLKRTGGSTDGRDGERPLAPRKQALLALKGHYAGQDAWAALFLNA